MVCLARRIVRTSRQLVSLLGVPTVPAATRRHQRSGCLAATPIPVSTPKAAAASATTAFVAQSPELNSIEARPPRAGIFGRSERWEVEGDETGGGGERRAQDSRETGSQLGAEVRARYNCTTRDGGRRDVTVTFVPNLPF